MGREYTVGDIFSDFSGSSPGYEHFLISCFDAHQHIVVKTLCLLLKVKPFIDNRNTSNTMPHLDGKVLAVTGAASGIGRATAQILISAGASVSLGDVNTEGIRELKDSYPQEVQDRIITFEVDVSDRKSVSAFVAHTIRTFSHIDGLAHIAAIAGPSLSRKKIWEVENSEFQRIYRVNAEGTFNVLSEFLKPGIMAEGGSIVVIGSYSGLRGMINTATYGSSKAAVMHLAKVAAIEAAPRKIRVNVVAP